MSQQNFHDPSSMQQAVDQSVDQSMQQPVDQSMQQPVQQKKSNKRLFIVIGVFLAICLIVVLSLIAAGVISFSPKTFEALASTDGVINYWTGVNTAYSNNNPVSIHLQYTHIQVTSTKIILNGPIYETPFDNTKPTFTTGFTLGHREYSFTEMPVVEYNTKYNTQIVSNKNILDAGDILLYSRDEVFIFSFKGIELPLRKTIEYKPSVAIADIPSVDYSSDLYKGSPIRLINDGSKFTHISDIHGSHNVIHDGIVKCPIWAKYAYPQIWKYENKIVITDPINGTAELKPI